MLSEEREQLNVEKEEVMTILTEVKKENADKNVAGVMENFVQAVGSLPRPLELLAGSPGLFMKQASMIGYYRNHPNLDTTLLACIRYLSAAAISYRQCLVFNRNLLKLQGATEEELDAMLNDPGKAPLEEKEIALLRFVVDGVKGKKQASQADLAALQEFGWTESDIIDAVNQGFGMLSHGRFVEYFQG